MSNEYTPGGDTTGDWLDIGHVIYGPAKVEGRSYNYNTQTLQERADDMARSGGVAEDWSDDQGLFDTGHSNDDGERWF